MNAKTSLILDCVVLLGGNMHRVCSYILDYIIANVLLLHVTTRQVYNATEILREDRKNCD